MRKVVKRPDGSEEAIEGTPDEVREYERIVESDRTPKQKSVPGLIKGKEADPMDGIRRLLDGFIPPKESGDRFPMWPHNSGPFWITSCSICQRNPCKCQYFGSRRLALGLGLYC